MTRPVSHAQALEALAEVAELREQIDHLYTSSPDRRDLIGKAQHHLGIALKVAGVYADLALSEAVADFLDDLNDPMPAGLPDRMLRLIQDGPPPEWAVSATDGMADDLEAARESLEGAGAGVVVAHLCGQCNDEAVTFPPPRCAAHGGLS